MATQNTIYSCENSVIDAKVACDTALEAFSTECKLNDGKLYDENLPAWQDLYNSVDKLNDSMFTLREFLNTRLGKVSK